MTMGAKTRGFDIIEGLLRYDMDSQLVLWARFCLGRCRTELCRAQWAGNHERGLLLITLLHGENRIVLCCALLHSLVRMC